jgi:hypothetical protein
MSTLVLKGTMSSPAFTKIFVPFRLLLGIGLAILGVVVLLVVYFFVHRLSLMTLAAGPLFVVLGLGVAFTSNAEACAGCREVLEETYASIPLALDGQMRGAVQAMNGGGIDAIVATLQGAPLPPPNAPATSSLEMTYCPKCKQLARVSSGQRRVLPDGQSTPHELSAPIVLVGPAVSHVLTVITARNEAWQKMVYGGVLPG